ncbi:MAG: SMI1/KNR4 family protein [Planctomycetaceae bacterium]
MTLKRFEEFVQHHAAWFRGFNPEPLRNLVRAEQHLGVTLPASLKWLLSHYGYWRATGVGGLPFVVATTLGCRPAFPASWVVLSRPACASFRGEPSRGSLPPASGYVVLITSAGKAADGKAVIVCDAEGTILRRYSGYSSYVMALQESLASCTDPNYQACQPAFHRNTSGVLCVSDDMFDLEEFRRRLVETITFFSTGISPWWQPLPQSASPMVAGNARKPEKKRIGLRNIPIPAAREDAGTGDMSAGNSTGSLSAGIGRSGTTRLSACPRLGNTISIFPYRFLQSSQFRASGTDRDGQAAVDAGGGCGKPRDRDRCAGGLWCSGSPACITDPAPDTPGRKGLAVDLGSPRAGTECLPGLVGTGTIGS